MPDNINVTPGSGATIAADEVAGVLYQRIKLAQGVDGAATDVSMAAPLAVQMRDATGAALGMSVVGGKNRLDVAPGSGLSLWRDSFETFDPQKWSTVATGAGDLVLVDGNVAGAAYLVISKDPFQPGTTTSVESLATFDLPGEVSVMAHTSQRTLGQALAVEVISTDTPAAAIPDTTISSISQAGSVLSVTTATPHGLKAGMRFGVAGVPDSRLNYPALVVASTPTPTTLTATAGPGGTIPSVTAGPFTGGVEYARQTLGNARDGSSIVFENTTPTNASFFVVNDAGDVLPSGTVTGNHSVTVATSASVQALLAAAAYAFTPPSEQRLAAMLDGIQWADAPVDAVTAFTSRLKRTQVIPDPGKRYRVRFRCVNEKGLTVPVAHIQSVTKSGSTTATVVTQTPHGLTVGDVIAAYGVRDQTNFANLVTATAIASIVDASTFTVVWGAAVTAASQAGVIVRVNGGNLPSALGYLAQTVQSVARAANVLTLIGSAAWTGISIGDLVNLAGLHDTSGAELNLDGSYRIRDVATTSLVIEPVGSAPTGADLATINCGGTVVKRTDLRVSFVRVTDFDALRTEPMQRATGDAANAQPVFVTSNSGSNIAVGIAAHDAVISGAPVRIGARARTDLPAVVQQDDVVDLMSDLNGVLFARYSRTRPFIDVASAARTVSGNSGAIASLGGQSLSGVIAVTAVSGTAPTLDLTLEESFDDGTTWQTIWSAPRLTGAGTVAVPPMLVHGRRRWAWNVGGTTPSFTFSITTMEGSAGGAPLIRSLIDRTINPNTLGSATAALNIEGCNNLVALCRNSTAGSPATAYQVQISHDGVNYAAVGAPVSAASTAPVAILVSNLAARFARVAVATAGTGAVLGDIALQGLN